MLADLEIPFAFRELFEPARYKAYYGGRGGAKSHSFAMALIIMGHLRPLRILCCREIQKSISASVKQLLDDKIAMAGLQGFYHSTQYGITGLNGTQFMFAGLRSNPASIKSIEGLDIAWIEEANTVSQRSIELLIPTLRGDTSEIWASWNRQFITDPIDKMFLGKDGPPPRTILRKVNWDQNPYFPQVLMDEMLWDKHRDLDKWRHVWQGEPVLRSEARVFTNWRIDDLDDTLPKDLLPRLGADWGFSIDPTTLIECYVHDRTLYFRREAYKVRCEIDETPSLFAGTDTHDPIRWANRFNHPGMQSVRDGNVIIADSARPETISYMRNRGFNIRRAIKGAGSVEEGVEFMKSYDIVAHPDCKHLETELIHYSYKEDPLTNEILPVLADRHNHMIDAARYALEGTRKADTGEIALTPPELYYL